MLLHLSLLIIMPVPYLYPIPCHHVASIHHGTGQESGTKWVDVMLTTWPASVVDAGSGGDMSQALTSWSLHAGKKIMLASHMNERLSWKKHPGYLG